MKINKVNHKEFSFAFFLQSMAKKVKKKEVCNSLKRPILSMFYYQIIITKKEAFQFLIIVKSKIKYTYLFILTLVLVACVGNKNKVKTTENTNKNLNTKGISELSDNESKAQYSFIKAESFFLTKEYDKAIIMFDEVIKLNPKEAAAYYKKATCYERKGELSKAIIQSNTAIEKNPKGEQYYLFLIELYKRTDNLQQAIGSLQSLINNTKKYKYFLSQADLYSTLANNEGEKRQSFLGKTDNESIKNRMISEQKITTDYSLAIRAMNNYEEKIGKREDVIKSKQQLYLLLGDYKNAFYEGQKLIQLMPRAIAYKFKQAEIIANYQNLDASIEFMKSIIKENPSSATARLILADFYKRNNQHIFYKNELDATFSLPEVNLDQKVKLVNQMLNQSKTEESKSTALEMAKKIVVSNPKSPQAHSILGDAYLVNSQTENARNAFVNALTFDTYKSQIWLEVLKLDLELQQTDSIEIHAKKALVFFSEEVTFSIYLADALVKKNQYSQAKDVLEKCLMQLNLNLESDQEKELRIRLGDVYFTLKEYKSCFEQYEKVMEHDPNNALATNNYSYYLAEGGGDLNLAKTMMSNLVRLFPKDLNFLDTYGWILFKIGEYTEALEYLKKASANGKGIVLEHTGDTAYKNNQLDLALEYWKKAYKTGEASTLIEQKINEKKIP